MFSHRNDATNKTKEQIMKTKITTDEVGRVTVEYDSQDWTGDVRRVRTFFCPSNGGYVREVDSRGQYPQVCDRLAGSGATLYCKSSDGLPDLIRREYRAMRRAEKREDNRQ